MKKRTITNPEGKGGWKKGQSGNPKGRPHNSQMAQFREALIQVEEEMNDTSLLVHAIRRAYKDKDSSVLIAILKKLLPDLSSTEITNLTLADIMKRVADEE